MTLAGLPLGNLSGALRVRDGRLHLDRVEVVSGLGSLVLHGDGALGAPPDWRIGWEASEIDLERLTEALDSPLALSGTAAGSGQAWFDADRAGLDGSVTAKARAPVR